MKRKNRQGKALPYILLTPIILIMCGLVIYPIIVTFTYSLENLNLTTPDLVEMVGLNNYIELLKSDSFWYSFANTMYLLIIVVLLTTLFGILVSLLLNIDTKLSGILMALAVLPWAMPPIVNGIIWKFIFHPGYGFMNKLLIGLGLTDKPVEWMSSRFLLLTVVAIVVAWRSVPFCAIVCLAGLKALPTELYEAAKIDGAGRMGVFRYITAPLMRPFIGIGVTSASITAINIFDEIVALSGYSDLGKNLLIESYLTTFSFLDFGKGSALTYLIMIISAIFGVFYLRSLNKEVEY